MGSHRRAAGGYALDIAGAKGAVTQDIRRSETSSVRPNSGRASWSPPPAVDEVRLVQLIGRGGMGEVYLGHDQLLDRPVAVKFISALEPDSVARERFILEARAAARLSHPNVLTIYRVGELDGRPFIITEFIHGTSLDHLAKPLPWRRALELGIGLSRGLAAAHRRGVLHRDIKPANAIVTDDGQVKLLDFGLAKLLDLRAEESAPALRRCGAEDGDGQLAELDEELSASLTHAGELMGTPDYISPEIWRGEPATRRSDVYALGALLFELCTGAPPHDGVPLRAMPLLVQRRDAPHLLELVPGVDPLFAAAIERCLRRDPDERFASGEELREALEQIERAFREIASPIPEGNPYRGLRAFEAEHRGLFFGRRAEISAVLDRMRAEPFVVVAGDSGTGKSSLCRAGVLPILAEDALGDGRSWSVLTIQLGRVPMSALASALAGRLGLSPSALVRSIQAEPASLGRSLRRHQEASAGIVLFIDQLEELVTMAEPAQAELVGRALGHLAAGIPGVRLLATVRSDHLARVAAVPGIGDEVARGLYLLRPLSPEGIREAIVGPARAKGVIFENDALVRTLIESTSSTQGSLPLLQFALAELWEARDPTKLSITAASLESIGGVDGALARHADNVLLGMPPAQRAAARRILVALITPEGTRMRRDGDELCLGDPAVHAALEALVLGRLLVAHDAVPNTSYEIAHEALLKGWSTLARWIDQQADTRAVRKRLEAAAAEWERLGRSREALWSGRQLTEAASLLEGELSLRDAAFLSASRRKSVRARFFRRTLAIGLPLTLALAYGALRIHTQRQLDAKVLSLTKEADVQLQVARSAAAEAHELRRSAFARFDARAREEGEVLWAKAQSHASKATHAFANAGQVLETAITVNPAEASVQALLGDVLYERALLADETHHPEQRDDLLQRLAVYDQDGSHRRRYHAPARLRINSSPPGAEVTLFHYEADAQGRRPLRRLREIGPTPAAVDALAPGSYLLTLTAPGRVRVRYPVLLSRGEELSLELALPAKERVPEGFVYIPPGRFLFGSAGDEEARRAFFNTVPIHEVETGAYLIAKQETTYAEWLSYLRSLPWEERVKRTPNISGLTGALTLEWRPGEDYRLVLQPTSEVYTARVGELIRYRGRTLREAQNWLRFPVAGISLDDARAYAAWLAATGRVPGARLCTEKEWERAARGADDREFPHGDRLEPDDANIDMTYGKKPQAFGPDEVGSHPLSQSPFGLDDMCGNVFEWTVSSLADDEHVARGGAYYYDNTTVRSTNRQVAEPTIRGPILGIRICASFDPEGKK